MKSNKLQDVIIHKLNVIESKVDEVRTKDLPSLKADLESTKARVEERTGKRATAITVVGGLITLAASVMAAYVLK